MARESGCRGYFINGENIRDKDMIELRRNIGYAIQGSVLFPHMTVEQNISYVPNLLNKKDKKAYQGSTGQMDGNRWPGRRT